MPVPSWHEQSYTAILFDNGMTTTVVVHQPNFHRLLAELALQKTGLDSIIWKTIQGFTIQHIDICHAVHGMGMKLYVNRPLFNFLVVPLFLTKL